MNKTLTNAIMFTIGAAIGSLVTWKVIKTKYERVSQEEIDSVKEEYGRLRDIMIKEIDACRNVVSANQNADDDENDEASDDKDKDDDYPEDDDRDFTEHEREMIDYYKISSRYRKTADENEISKEGDAG